VSRLEFYSRPLVAFDPTNKDHRRWFDEFRKYGGWGKCPVRFLCPSETGSDLVKMITRELVDYYIQKEFVAKKPQKKVVQKKPKTVDKVPKQ
jgi:hypothetical protein